ncbi:MAG: DUF1667 domain-containing protein [Candidatus Omnitrophica bacterium]|nr:DUF1667 domain-containing protein [Candidatus Omnitrophota bacterium]
MICTECPVGCALTVDMEGCEIREVTGNKCAKGQVYAVHEAVNPERVLTTTVLTLGMPLKMLPVRTSRPVPKDSMLELMSVIRKMRVTGPVKAGDVIAGDLLGMGIDLVATRDM